MWPSALRRSWSLVYFGFVLLVAWDKPFMGRLLSPGLSIGIVLGALVIVAAWLLTWVYVRWANRVYDPELGPRPLTTGGAVSTAIGQANPVAIAFFFLFIAVTLGITWWAARRTRTTEHFYAAGRTISRGPERHRARGRLHERRVLPRHRRPGVDHRLRRADLFDRLAGRLAGGALPDRRAAPQPRQVHLRGRGGAAPPRQAPVRIAAALGTLATVIFYLIAQMVGAGGLIRLMFGISYEAAIVIVGAVDDRSTCCSAA